MCAKTTTKILVQQHNTSENCYWSYLQTIYVLTMVCHRQKPLKFTYNVVNKHYYEAK